MKIENALKLADHLDEKARRCELSNTESALRVLAGAYRRQRQALADVVEVFEKV